MALHRCVSVLALVFCVASASAAPPTVADDRLVIELAAAEPDIVTPTGIAVDEQDRVWVIENNTHERPANYKGHPSDRIRIFSDPGPDGKFRKITTFADGFKNAMGLALSPTFYRDGIVYLATRSDIWKLHCAKDKDEADERKVIVKLDTTGTYPHNGLSGFTFDSSGDLYFSLGENLGAPYKLIGSDDTTLSGGGEGGSIYHCKPDGTKLERMATGFWNTFHLTFDGFGRLFAVDNDPDARGPCRLLHIVQGGDYGYRFRYGRKGLHPFTAWNGELPGTLPMVAGTAEAPSGIVAYESNGLPDEYRGRLLVTSWGDHVVEQFTLSPRGASFSAKSSILVRGGDDFRPVGIATAPDGSLYLSDWVDKSYPVHGKGRIWHIRMKNPPKDDGLRASKVAGLGFGNKREHLLDPRREIRTAAGDGLVGTGMVDPLIAIITNSPDVRARLHAMWSLSNAGPPLKDKLHYHFLDNSAAEVRAESARLVSWPRRRSDIDPFLETMAAKDPSPLARMHAVLQLKTDKSLATIVPLLGDADPYLASAAIEVIGRSGNLSLLAPAVESKEAALRLGALVALRRSGKPKARDYVPTFLADPDPAVRRAAVQWVGEDKLQDYKDAIATAAAKEPVTRELFEALLASQELLGGNYKPGDEPSGEVYVARVVKDSKQPAIFRTLGLRMLRPDHPVLTPGLLQDLLASPDKALRAEAVRTLALRSDNPAQDMLLHLAADDKADDSARSFAVLGLGNTASTSAEARKVLLSLLGNSTLQRDALRSLRGVSLDADERRMLFTWWDKLPNEEKPSNERRELAEQVMLVLGPHAENEVEKADVERRKMLTALVPARPNERFGWQVLSEKGGDPVAGERVFFHARGPRCASCHRIDGRGGVVGPDLSAIADSSDRNKLIDSVLTPSKEIAPAFTTWVLTMRSGKQYTGVIISENFDSTITFGEADGKTRVLNRIDIDDRQASTKSLMPDDLHSQMTRREFLDLLAFLGQSRKQVTTEVKAEADWQAIATDQISKDKPGYGGLSGVTVDHATGTVFVQLSDRGVFRSKDKGATWERVGKEFKGRTEWPGCLVLDPTGKSKSLLCATVYGGPVAVASLKDDSWRLLDNKSMHVDWCSVDWTDPEMTFVLALKHESGGLLLVSADGGKRFDEVGKGYGPAWVFDGSTAVVAEAKTKEKPKPGLVRTTDGGKTFKPCGDYSATALPKWRGDTLYWLVDSALIKTTDAGKSWDKVCEFKDGRYGPIFGKDAKHMFVLTGAGVVESTDAGATWSKPLLVPKDLKGVSALTWMDYDPVNDVLYVMKMTSELYRMERGKK